MREESTTPDLVELTRRAFEVASDHDTDALMGFYAPDAVLDLSDVGIGTFEGVAAIRGFLDDWWGTWADHLLEPEEFVDLGHGVTFSPVREEGRLVGSDRHVEHRRGIVLVWAQGRVERHIAYHEIDEARAAAERLAEERG
jgi:ketosteroid isomerase-like protein